MKTLNILDPNNRISIYFYTVGPVFVHFGFGAPPPPPCECDFHLSSLFFNLMLNLIPRRECDGKRTEEARQVVDAGYLEQQEQAILKWCKSLKVIYN